MKRKLLFGFAIVALLIGGSLYWLLWRGDAEPLLSQANQVKIPAGWQLTHEEIVKKQNLCLNKLGCPGISRVWQLDRMYTDKELHDIFQPLHITMEDACKDYPGAHGSSVFVCAGKYQTSKEYFSIDQSSNDERTIYTLLLTMKRLGNAN